jgi:hypothetical protein
MAERDQLRRALGGGDAGDARDLEWVALWILRQLAQGRRAMRTKACARAVRRVSGLPLTSTIRVRRPPNRNAKASS